MKPNSALSGAENILSLVAAVNPGAVITPNQVSFSSPVPDPEIVGLTALTITALPDEGYRGSSVVYYTRHPATPYIVEGDFVIVVGDETDQQLLEKIATHHGLVSTELSVTDPVLPSLAGPQITTVSISTKTDSLVYLTSSVDVNLTVVEMNEMTRYDTNGNPRVSDAGIIRFAAPEPEPEV